MARRFNVRGSIVALVTPFGEDGAVDFAALEGLIEFHVANGTDGLLICGTTGETPTLSEGEYVEVVAFAVEKANRRLPVIAGAGTNATATTVRNCEAAASAGADALLVVGPYYNKPTAVGFYEHFVAAAQATPLPLIVYNVPGRTGKNIPTSVVLRLAGHYENVVGVKEASGDMNQIMDILRRRPDGFLVYSGDDALAFPMVALGAEGCVSVAANEIPREFASLMRLALAGELDKARALHFKYLNLMNLNFVESNPIPVKTALGLMGMIRPNFRLPMCRMEEANRGLLAAELKYLGLIS
jgi:4-hydroxy-tetrahydrodipicolinate synthase